MEMKDVSIRRIGLPDIELIREFINNAGDSLTTFRYFDKRPLAIIKQHVVTCGIIANGRLIGYGHLDKAPDGIWLGVAVQENVKGKGYGKQILQYLTDFAKRHVKDTVKLTVDKNNPSAIALYRKFGFRIVGDINERSLLMELNVNRLNVFISSLALMTKPVRDMVRIAQENNWALEFSSGIPYDPEMEKIYLDANVTRMPHNYFPAPEIPFVLNLASTNSSIRSKSIEHCKKGLWLAKQSHSPFFAAHAGFCIDPDPNELGKKITIGQALEKEKNKSIFLESLKEVLETADQLGVDFLIENNVIASFNLTEEGENPLLCCDEAEINWLFAEIHHRRLGLLLDTAHLKVSCKTLNLKPGHQVKAISPVIKGIHHSDNDGFVDSNQPINDDYWFRPYLKNFSNIVHVLEVKNLTIESIQQQINLLSNES